MSGDWYDEQKQEQQDKPRGVRPYARSLDEDTPTRRKEKVHHDTFSLFRPWRGCSRCKKELGPDLVGLPENSDYVCPHTRKAEYVELIASIRNNPNMIRLSHREFSTDRGETFAQVTWATPEEPVAVAPRKAPLREL